MMNSNFCHLHTHSELSTLDGIGSPKVYAKKAAEMGFKYLAITDHANIDGTIKFQNACDEYGISPITGVELYMVPDASARVKEKRFHINIFVKNMQGWIGLNKMLTRANLEGFYYKPRIDPKMLLDCDLSNFIISTACVASFLNMENGFDLFKQLSDRTDVYFELMPNDLPEQHELHQKIYDFVQNNPEYKNKLILTADVHYPEKEDAKAQEVLLAIQRKAKWDDPKRFRFTVTDLYLKSADEMSRDFKKDIFTQKDIMIAMRNTIKIARECCDFRIPKQEPVLPKMAITKEVEMNVLRQIAFEGFKDKVLDPAFTKNDYLDRLNFELKVINEKGYAGYFLIVYEMIKWCKDNGILAGPGRGSVGGSIVAYLTGITHVDPLKHGLLFERFISLERKDPPDIDTDIPDIERQKVIDHLKELYGENKVCGLSTFMRLRSRAVVRDVSRVFDIGAKEVDVFAKSIDFDSNIQQTIEEKPEGKEFVRKHPEVIDMALRLEGQIKSCISGDSRVILQNDFCGAKPKKIKNLYKEGFRGKIRCYDIEKDILYFETIKDIFIAGIKKVYDVRVGINRKIRVTGDHRFLTKEGWKEACLLTVNDSIAVNGRPKSHIPWNKGLKGVQVPWNKGLTKEDHHTIMESSIRMRENNPAKLPHAKEIISEKSFKHGLYSIAIEYRKANEVCEICKVDKSSETHHINRDRHDNALSNLLALCTKCHHELHWEERDVKELNMVNPEQTIKWIKFSSIEYVGIEETYDIEMDGPYQNFVCNRIVVHNSGRHPAALIISDEDLTTGERGHLAIRSNQIVSNWAMDDCEHIGLMKLDILGLKTLSVLNECKRLIHRTNSDFKFSKITFDDPKIFENISSGYTAGLFQISTPFATKIVKDMCIDNFNDLAAALALGRPGPFDCVTGDTVVRGWSGKEIRVDHIDVGRPIASSAFAENGKNRYVRNKVEKVLFSGVKDVYEVATSDNKKIKCTNKHKFFVKRERPPLRRRKNVKKQYDEKGSWLPLKEIKKGDLVLTRNVAPNSEKIRIRNEKMMNRSTQNRFKKGHTPWNKGSKNCTDYFYLRSSDPDRQSQIASMGEHGRTEKLKDPIYRKKMFENLEKMGSDRWDEEERKRHTEIMIDYYSKNEHPNSKGINVSKPQRELYENVLSHFGSAELEYRFDYIDEEGRIRFFSLDIAIPDKKINIEYDGGYWHKNPGSREDPRDSLLEKDGWTVIRITEKTKKEFIKNLPKITKKNSIKWSIINEIKFIGPKKTYDIVTNDQDFPNYIANDFIVHNSGQTQEYIDRKKGQLWDRKHPVYEEVTKDTFSIICYQEQIMQVMMKVAGLSGVVANQIRKVIGKKRDVKEFLPFQKMFVEGCLTNKTLSEEEAYEFWEMLEKHARYSFPKAHAVEYAMITYWTAYCKHYHSTEFISAALTYSDKTEEMIAEARRMNLKVMPPKIGLSNSIKWDAKGDCLYAPFIEIKGIGEKQAYKICAEKESTKKGFFKLQEEVGVKGKLKELLVELCCYDKDLIPENADKYFSFPLNGMSPIPLNELKITPSTFRNTAVTKCEKCALFKGCRKPIRSNTGNTNIAILTDFPDVDDDKSGKLLSSSSGDILFDKLEKNGYTRGDFFITAANRCAPLQGSTIEPQKILECKSFLQEEIERNKIQLVLCLGKNSLFTLTGQTTGILRLNATTEWNYNFNCWVSYCMHPKSTYVMNNRENEFINGIDNFIETLNQINF